MTKKRRLSVLLIVICLVFSITTVYADENNLDVEPNIYEKKEILINRNNRQEIMQKEELPEEQKVLTFEQMKATNSDVIKEQLFQNFIIKTNTITAKSDQLGLFSSTDTKLRSAEEEEIMERSGKVISLLIGTVIIVITLMFLLIIPRLKRNDDEKRIVG